VMRVPLPDVVALLYALGCNVFWPLPYPPFNIVESPKI
jgi:hypothetical protein